MNNCFWRCLVPLIAVVAMSIDVQAQDQKSWATATNQDIEFNWSQWGGPQGNFRLPAQSLAKTWSIDGPPVLWKRDLGGGYAGLAVHDEQLFTSVRQGQKEVDIALGMDAGKTLWSRELSVPEVDLDYGMGPFATPLIDGEQVIFFGGNGVLRARDTRSGKLNWQLDFLQQNDKLEPKNGYAASPIMVDGKLMLIVGGEDSTIVAVNPKNGKILWSKHNLKIDYASPVCLRVGGAKQLVCHVEDFVISINPENGNMHWKVASKSTKTQHVIAPIQLAPECFLASTTYSVKAYKWTSSRPELIWESNAIRSQVGNLIYLPELKIIIGAKGASVGSPIAALDMETGEQLWRSRGMQCGFHWKVGNRLFTLSRSGELVQGIASRQGLEVLGRHQVFQERKVWSAPAVADGKVFLKSQDQIIAYDLSK